MGKAETAPKKEWKAAMKYVVVLFVPLALTAGGVTMIIYRAEIRADLTSIRTHERNAVAMIRAVITHDFQTVISDLMVMVEKNEFQALLETRETAHRTALAKEFFSYAARKKRYDQIRFLDETGMEIIRVNYNNGNPYVVSEKNLQSKKGRYYFAEAFRLGRGEIFVSPFDLNVEHGEIETPIKPMIRFGTPVFDAGGRKRGIMLFNYFGATIIRNIESVHINTPGQIMLVNRDGYWMKSPYPEDEWGFMYEARKERRFQNDHPRAWEHISRNSSGQFFDDGGVFTFATFYPLRSGKNPHFWKLVSHIPSEALEDRSREMRTKYFQLNLFVFPLLALCSWLPALAHVRRSRFESELKKAKEAAEAASQAKSEFLTSMSHEFRTPLHAILGFSRMIARHPPLSTEHRNNMETVIRNGEHLLMLINDVLDMSELETGGMKLTNRNFDLHGMLNDLEDKMRVRAEGKDLHLAFERSSHTPRFVRADGKRLRQVLENLLDNAMKFTSKGGVTVRVSSCDPEAQGDSHPPQAGRLCFEVEDTGPGIPPEASDTLFDAFARSKETEGWREGTGLGLAISYRFVGLMGGSLIIRPGSEGGVKRRGSPASEGPGALFRFDIRADPVDAPDIQTVLPDSANGDHRFHRTADLTSLPAELLVELKRAAIAGDTDEIDALIGKMGAHDPESARHIAVLAREYEHDRILKLIDKTGKLRDEQTPRG